MVGVELFYETLMVGPQGSFMAPAGSIQDVNYDRAQYIVGTKSGRYTDPPPHFTSGPTLSAYNAVEGDLLRCFPGTFEGVAGGEFQWMKTGVPITGETTNSYTVRAGDNQIWCRVTLRNLSGSAVDQTPPCTVT